MKKIWKKANREFDMQRLAVFTGSDLRTYGGGEKEAISETNILENYKTTIYSFVDSDNLRLDFSTVRGLIKPDTEVVYYSPLKLGTHRDINPLSWSGFRALVSTRNFDTVYSMHPGFLLNTLLTVLSRLFNFKYILGMHSPVFFDFTPSAPGIFSKPFAYLFNRTRNFLIKNLRYARVQNVVEIRRLKEEGFSGYIYNIPPLVKIGSIPLDPIDHEGRFEVLFVGRLESEQKGLDLLEDIIVKTLEKTEMITFTIVGSGSAENHLSKFAKNYPNNVHLMGFLSENELVDAYKGASLFVFPSRWENFGISLCEALMWGVPSIGFKVMGSEEIIKDELQGYLINPFDTDMFSEKVIEYFSEWEKDQDAYVRRKKEISRYMKDNFGEKAISEKLALMFSTQVAE